MKFTINRAALLERISTAAKAITIPNPRPAYTGLWIHAGQDHLSIMGTDENFTIQTLIMPGELTMLDVQEPGDMVLESRFLIEIVRKMDGSRITIETESPEDRGRDIAIISDENNTYRMNYRNAESHQSLSITPKAELFTVPGKIIKEIVQTVGYCVASETESRVVLKGINLQASGNSVEAGATDSFRMSLMKIPVEDAEKPGIHVLNPEEPLDFSLTIPIRPLRELSRSISDDETVYVTIDRRNIRFDYDKTTFTTTLQEGRFPDLKSIIPPEDKVTTVLTVNGSELQRLVDRATIFYSTDNEAMRFIMSEQEMKLFSSKTGVGDSCLTMMDYEVQGQGLKLTCNGRYLLEALRAVQPQENIQIHFCGELGPFRIEDPGHPEQISVIVPIRSYEW